ncbi:MAG TPA: HAMP domain-containing sensor histidine kinase [Patescibacteria group bacterium]|jgi:two-component system sensor histidine kinase CiaH|nr:HAMP domain-containing sensor histidine kinase [Patescibacteria group bacterium]
MFRSTTLKLTLAYLGIIMILSLIFSFMMYSTYEASLTHGFRSVPMNVFFNRDVFEGFRLQRINEGLDHMRMNLVLVNIGTLVLGGAASYVLARRSLQPLEQAFGLQTRFTSDASHELRTPLANMQTEIEVALRDPELTKVQAKAILASNLEEVQRLRSLSEGLLQLSQAADNKIALEPIRLQKIIESALRTVEAQANIRHITFDQDIADLSVSGTSQGLRQLFVILLDNAIKYSAEHTTVTIKARTSGKHAAITVADQGCGIPAHALEHVFERFYRVDQSRTRNQVDGYGLGLSIAKQIVEAHHGDISATSQPGKGSMFTVKLSLSI